MNGKARFQFCYSGVPKLTMVDCSILIGATGAVTSFTGNLIQSVVRNSTGFYTLTLKGPITAMLSAQGMMQSPASGLSGISSIELDNTTNMAAATPIIVIQTLDAAGAIADPADGSRILMSVFGRDSSVQY